MSVDKAHQATVFRLTKFREKIQAMHDEIIESLGKETKRIINNQLLNLNQAIGIDNFLNKNQADQAKTIGVNEVKKWISQIENERQKLDRLEMVLAVVGTMKAGKSTTINAIVGMEVLPNRETPMTTLPTLVRNKPGQHQPILTIKDTEPLQKLSQDVANKLKQIDVSNIDLNGIEDGKTLINTLNKQGEIQFAASYPGHQAIFAFLKQINDLLRLAKDPAIAIEPPYQNYKILEDLPTIEVEFNHLKNQDHLAQGSLAILDTPGPNEFGQSETLKVVFIEQLKQASAILLVTDFTQMKSIADQEVRLELAELEEYLTKDKDRLAVIVNKYDQTNANSMSKDEVKRYVADTLMGGKIDTDKVFPGSAFYGYLAGCVTTCLSQTQALPSPDQKGWVADFAKKAFGEAWEAEELTDLAQVAKKADILWKKSEFEAPITNVIHAAHATAAQKCLLAAIDRLANLNAELTNTVSIHVKTMDTEISAVEQIMKDLQRDINRCHTLAGKIESIVKQALFELNDNTNALIQTQVKHIENLIIKFFKAGKQLEQKQKEKLSQEAIDKINNKNVRFILKDIFSSGSFSRERINKAIKRAEEKAEQLFDPDEPKVKFRYEKDAREFLEKIIKEIENIFENEDMVLKQSSNRLINKTRLAITKKTSQLFKDILENAQKELNDNGFNVYFNLPTLKLITGDINTEKLMVSSTKAESKIQQGRRYKEGVFGWICEQVGAKDWGKETYTYYDDYFIVDLVTIKENTINLIKQHPIQINSQINSYLEGIFMPVIDQKQAELVEYLTRYKGVLDDSIQASQLEQKAKAELKMRLVKLAKSQVILEGDITAAEALLPK